MTAYVKKTEFLDIYLAYPDTPPPQPCARQPPQLQCPQSQTPETEYVDSTPLLEYILNELKQEGIYQAGAWVGLPQDSCSKMVEKDAYKVLTRILEKVTLLTRKYYPELKRLPGKWLCTNERSIQSWSGNAAADLGPGYIFAHNETPLNKALWSRTFAVLEVEQDTQQSDSEVDRQLKYYVGNIFAEQVDRLFVNAVTLRSWWELQVYRFDRSGVVFMDQRINIHEDPKAFIQVIASFSYLSPTNLGWDPACKIWDSVVGAPRPSYDLSHNIFRECGIYDLPWVFEVDDESFVAIKAVNDKRRLSIWGRASFVVHVVTLADWESKNEKAPVYILKQCWQRLPGLKSDPKTAELQNAENFGDQHDRGELIEQFKDIDQRPFEETVMLRAKWESQIRKSWMVKLDGMPVTTLDTLRKKHGTPIPELASEEENQNIPSHQALVTRTLVRLVFDRPGWSIQRFMSKRELLEAVKMIVEELGSLYEAGVIHRDVSPSNLIISDSEKPGGHIIDFDHSKIAYAMSEVTQPKESEDVEKIAFSLLQSRVGAMNYVFKLRLLWESHDRTPTPRDFHWPETIDSVFRFGNHIKGKGFFTGTYQYLSPHLKTAPFHHSCHDLDSLWWSVNEMPLTLAGPGGKKQPDEDLPTDLLKLYYGGGPAQKAGLVSNLMINAKDLDAMTTQYSDYFKDLILLMTKWYKFVQIACEHQGYEHHHPHGILAEIIQEAIDRLDPETEEAYKDDADEEKKRREQDKADIAEAISNQMTVGALVKVRSSNTVKAENAADPTTSASAADNLPYRAATPPPVHISTVQSPNTGRVVKRSRVN